MKKRVNKKEKSKLKPQEKPPVEDQQESQEQPFNFGGIPNRDLKKNLGCR